MQVRKTFKHILIVGKGKDRHVIRDLDLSETLVVSANDSAIDLADFVVWTNRDLAFDFLDRSCRSDAQIVSPFEPASDRPVVIVGNRASDLAASEISLASDFLAAPLEFRGSTALLCMGLCEEVARQENRSIRVYMIGFDFHENRERQGFQDIEYLNAYFDSSKRAFLAVQKRRKELVATFIHVGNLAESDMDLERFKKEFEGLSISREIVDTGDHVEVVAEITTNHFGDFDRLEKMIREAKKAGADSIKLQKRNPLTFYPKEKLASHYASPFGTTFREYREGLELSRNDFERVDSICNELSLKWFCSILDIESFEFVSEFGPSRIKLPSTISEHRDLHQHVARNFHGEIVVSTGYTNSEYAANMRTLFQEAEKLYLLQCVSAYPAKSTETNVGVIRHYRDLSREPNSNIVPGYSSHDIGSLVSMMAVAAGARIIEKHVKLGNTDWAHFDNVAVDLQGSDFANFVKDIRLASQIAAYEGKVIAESEHHKYWVQHTSVQADNATKLNSKF